MGVIVNVNLRPRPLVEPKKPQRNPERNCTGREYNAYGAGREEYSHSSSLPLLLRTPFGETFSSFYGAANPEVKDN